MDFFRKLFPLMKTKKMTQDTNKTEDLYNVESTPLQTSSQLDINSNIEENILNINEHYLIHDDAVELDCNKILSTLENVAPIKIYPNITQNESKDKEIIDDVLEDVRVLDNMLHNNISENDNTTSNDILMNHTNKGIETEKKSQETGVLTDITLNTNIDDKTMQNLREFEETLNNFDKTTCLMNVPAGELKDLDEFEDLFDNLDTVNNDVHSEISSANNDVVKNNYSAFSNDTIDNTKNNIENVTDSEKDSTILEKIDIISINSSSEEEKSLANDIKQNISINSDNEELNSECDGYNSSDFEFITETEANMDGFIINFQLRNNQDDDKLSISSSEPFSSYVNEAIGDRETGIDPGEGPSGLSRQKHEFEDRSYRNNHVIPDGDEYLGLFQGIYNPLLPVSEIFFLENKSVRASAMNVQYDGIGFDKQLALRRPQRDSSEDEFEDEAKECAKKILHMYPGENRKRRRRY